MAETTGSTVPRRQLGRYLRELRGSHRITVKSAAEQLEWSEAKIWRIETGQTSLRSLDVKQMCEVYGAPADLTEALMALARETKSRGWWQAFGDVIPEWFDVYVGLEEAAAEISWYEPELVPGLLQTEEYARTLIAADHPGGDEEEIDRRVQVRVQRQALVKRPTMPLKLRVVLNEAVLRRPVGSREVMATQLACLAEAGEQGNISIRVVPFGAGFHPGQLTGGFEILRFPLNGSQDSEPPTVYADGYTGALYLDKPAEVERYAGAFGSIEQASLDEPSSASLIRQAAEEMRT